MMKLLVSLCLASLMIMQNKSPVLPSPLPSSSRFISTFLLWLNPGVLDHIPERPKFNAKYSRKTFLNGPVTKSSERGAQRGLCSTSFGVQENEEMQVCYYLWYIDRNRFGCQLRSSPFEPAQSM